MTKRLKLTKATKRNESQKAVSKAKSAGLFAVSFVSVDDFVIQTSLDKAADPPVATSAAAGLATVIVNAYDHD